MGDSPDTLGQVDDGRDDAADGHGAAAMGDDELRDHLRDDHGIDPAAMGRDDMEAACRDDEGPEDTDDDREEKMDDARLEAAERLAGLLQVKEGLPTDAPAGEAAPATEVAPGQMVHETSWAKTYVHPETGMTATVLNDGSGYVPHGPLPAAGTPARMGWINEVRMAHANVPSLPKVPVGGAEGKA